MCIDLSSRTEKYSLLCQCFSQFLLFCHFSAADDQTLNISRQTNFVTSQFRSRHNFAVKTSQEILLARHLFCESRAPSAENVHRCLNATSKFSFRFASVNCELGLDSFRLQPVENRVEQIGFRFGQEVQRTHEENFACDSLKKIDKKKQKNIWLKNAFVYFRKIFLSIWGKVQISKTSKVNIKNKAPRVKVR